MKIIRYFCFFLSLTPIEAQRTILPTDRLSVEGEILETKVFTLADLDTFLDVDLDDVIIYNQEGEIKDTLTGIYGIPLKSFFSQLQFVYTKPRELNEFYFVFLASDGYSVVFSWNEIYNTSVGDGIYIITNREGLSHRELPERIMAISVRDLKTGRRYVKGLERILVKRIE